MSTAFLLFNFLGPEMLIVLLVVILLFGGRKIPELMKGLGKGIKEFKDASKEDTAGDNKRELDDKA